MPYKIIKSKDKSQVINSDTKEVKGTHNTHAEAYEQLQAIYASIQGARKHKKAEIDPGKLDTLLKAMIAHESGQQSGNFDNKLLNEVLTQMIPEIATKDSIMEAPAEFQLPPDTGFVQEGLQKRLWENIMSLAYPDIVDPDDELINSLAAMNLAKLDKPLLNEEDAKNLVNQVNFVESSREPSAGTSLQDILNREE